MFRLVAEEADLNKNGVIDYGEFISYLGKIDIKESPKSASKLIQRTDKVKVPTEEMQENIKFLKERTNLDQFNDSAMPIEKVVGMIETPYERFKLEEEYFMKKNENGKYKATILHSLKTTLLWYHVAHYLTTK